MDLAAPRSQLYTRLVERFLGLKPWQQIALAVGGALTAIVGSYATYFWYNYRELFILRAPKYIAPKNDDLTHYESKPELRIRVINLDGAMHLQRAFMEKYKPEVIDLSALGPSLRMDCTYSQYWAYEKALTREIGSPIDDDVQHRPLITFYGSNDFHHLSLPLIRRWRTPFNLVIFDNHPDWFGLYPGMHCGCWFTQASSLETVHQAFHFGGTSGEFNDNWGFHPWSSLISGKIAMFPTHSTWTSLKWKQVPQFILRPKSTTPITEQRVRDLLLPYQEKLEKYPLYITLDKDCLFRMDNRQNWNDGSIRREELMIIIKVLIQLSNNRLLGMDVTGEFTKVEVSGMYRSYLHTSQHDDAQNNQDQANATATNEATNMALMETLHEVFGIRPPSSGHEQDDTHKKD